MYSITLKSTESCRPTSNTRADVGVIQRRQRLGFAFEAPVRLRIGQELGPQRFERDAAFEARVARLENLAHAAAPQRADDHVRTELRTGLQGHALGKGTIIQGRQAQLGRRRNTPGSPFGRLSTSSQQALP